MKGNDMKARIISACLLFIIGIIPMIDWFIFCAKAEFKNLQWEAFKAAYVSHLPETIQPLFTSAMPWGTLIPMFLLALAGLLFFNTPYKLLKAAGLLCFLLSFWNLFSLM